jgi:23S rRNA pseudouridine1911/1915/1917 synthase
MSSALEILYTDNHLIAVDKPAGIPTVPDATGAASLFDLVRSWIETEFQKPGRAFLGVVHRLDRPVSGVVVFARTSKAAGRLSEAIREHRVRKVYWGVGLGEPRAASGELVQWLSKDTEANLVTAFERERADAKRAVTRWRVLAKRGGRTLYEFEPLTGRAHQLRVCAATLGTPLAGDRRYGARDRLADRSIALHARRLEIEHPTRKEPLVLESPAPRTEAWTAFAETLPPR